MSLILFPLSPRRKKNSISRMREERRIALFTPAREFVSPAERSIPRDHCSLKPLIAKTVRRSQRRTEKSTNERKSGGPSCFYFRSAFVTPLQRNFPSMRKDTMGTGGTSEIGSFVLRHDFYCGVDRAILDRRERKESRTVSGHSFQTS